MWNHAGVKLNNIRTSTLPPKTRVKENQTVAHYTLPLFC